MSKKKKESDNRYYSPRIAKARLSLAKEKYKVEYKSPETPREQKQIGKRLINKEDKRLQEQGKIEAAEEKIYQKSNLGKAQKYLVGMYDKYKSARISSKQIMKKGQMTAKMPAYVPENIWAHKNLFFQGELNNEKRSLYFS